MTTPTLAEVFRKAINDRLIDLHTAMPGRVLSYDVATQTADIEPQLKRAITRANGEVLTEVLPVLPSVPLVFPRGGGYFLSFPIAVGDFVLVVFAERSIDQWRRSGDMANPGDTRTHGLGNAVAIPGLFPAGEPIEDAHAENVAIGRDGGSQVHITPTGVFIGGPVATHPLVLGDTLNSWLSTHTHPTGTGPSGVPLQVATLPNHLSSKHKADS